MGREHATRPAGCACPWAQVHMDMPWQRLDTAVDCPVHAPQSAAVPVMEQGVAVPWVEPGAAHTAPIGLPPTSFTVTVEPAEDPGAVAQQVLEEMRHSGARNHRRSW